MLGAALLVLGRIGLLVAFADVVLSSVLVWLLPGPGLVPVLCASVVLLLLACAVLRDASLLWQVTLQALAVAGIVVGISLLMNALFHDWRSLISFPAVLAVAAIVGGIGCGVLLRKLQRHERK